MRATSAGTRARGVWVESLERRRLLAAFDVLVFSRTTGFRHDSIDEGIAAIRALGQANDFTVTATEDPTRFTAANLAQYEADLANPGAVYKNPARRDAYLRMYGNICYDTRDRYVNFPWSSERK